MDEKLNTFPSNQVEALTMLYLQSQDLSSLLPENLVHLYWETYYRIKKENSEARKTETEKWFR